MANEKSTGKAPASSKPAKPISAEEHHRLIAEAAYFRAQQRGFTGGDPLEDWLAAEQEISRALSSSGSQKKEERAA